MGLGSILTVNDSHMVRGCAHDICYQVLESGSLVSWDIYWTFHGVPELLTVYWVLQLSLVLELQRLAQPVGPSDGGLKEDICPDFIP